MDRYHKASYVVAGSVLGTTCLLLMSAIPHPGVLMATVMLGGVHLFISSADLLCEVWG
jgi:hypothetical protein